MLSVALQANNIKKHHAKFPEILSALDSSALDVRECESQTEDADMRLAAF
jgi:hypothetical protein